MKSFSEQELAETEVLLRQRLTQLADLAPTAVRLPGEIEVVADNRPTRRGRRAGTIAAIAALVGAGGFTTYSFIGASNDGGAATPQEAVMTFASAMEHEDVLGMIDVTAPEEVGVLRSAIDSITSDAKRVELLADDFNSSGVQGLDISVDGLVLDTNFLEGGLAAVTATSGTVTTTLDPASFPLGDKLRAVIGRVASDPANTAVSDLANSAPDVLLMTVERDGRWYVSLEYTIAEYVRRAAGWDVPGPLSRTPVGFDSPEAAANGFYERLAALDLQSAIDTFAPGEDAMGWLAQSWLPQAQAAVESGRADGWSLTISGVTYETIGSGDHLTMRPLTFRAEGTAPAGLNQDSTDPELSREPQTFTIERADGCTTVTGSIVASLFGTDLPPTATAVDGGFRLCSAGNEILGGLALLVSGSALELPAISVVQSGGQWYVSPLGTVLGSATINLHDIADGTSLFDSALGPFIYGGLSRGYLESMVDGQPADAIDPTCLPALTVDDGVVSGIVADPAPAAIRACVNTVSFPSSVSESGSETAPPATEVPVHTTVPASTP